MDSINNERDFLRVMDRIDKLLFSAVPGTPEADELERLSKMAEKYENKNNEYSFRGSSLPLSGDVLINSIKKRKK